PIRSGPWCRRSEGRVFLSVAAAGFAAAAVVSGIGAETPGGGGGVARARTADPLPRRAGESGPDREAGRGGDWSGRRARAARLVEAGVVVGPAVGRVVTGRIRTGAARRPVGPEIADYAARAV